MFQLSGIPYSRGFRTLGFLLEAHPAPAVLPAPVRSCAGPVLGIQTERDRTFVVYRFILHTGAMLEHPGVQF